MNKKKRYACNGGEKKKQNERKKREKFYRELFRDDYESFLTLGRLSIFYMH